jgi:pyruvate/2-oxoglutarate/acetoin dehydrogenase E1 component
MVMANANANQDATTTPLTRLAAEIAALLREDPRRVVLGEDVADGGMLGLTRDCQADEALAARLLSLPLTPGATIAHAAGLAMAGRRPLVILPSATALLDGFSGLRELCRLSGSAGGERSGAVVMIAPTGPGFGLGGDGAASPEDLLAALPGLRVICLGDARESVALLRAVAEFDAGEQPTLLLLPRALVLREVDDFIPVARPLGGAKVVRRGDQATVFAWGATLDNALAAAAESEADGISVAVVDVGGLSPLDADTLAAAAARTGKLVIAHPGWRSAVAAEVAALLADRALLHLDAPILRVGGSAGPAVYTAEADALPSVAALVAAIHEVVTF